MANGFDLADETLARAWELWRSGEDLTPPVLPEWRLLSIEASLRRAQHRFAEALTLLGRAQTACGGDRTATARLLLKREHVFEQQGDPEAALAVLAEAAPYLEGCTEPRLLSVHRFNTADNLVRVGRAAEAAALLPEVEALAAAEGNELDRIRVRWLGARVGAARGREEEALAALAGVQEDFTRLALPYDAALSALDLALLLLERGRTAEVRELALRLGWIFKAHGIRREATAALQLFCDAARCEAATLALARQVIADLETARRLPPPKPGKPAESRG